MSTSMTLNDFEP